jgi:hypothetical protein
VAAGDSGLISAVLNLLFWGVGYYHAGIKRPFGRTWLIWPVIYIIYAAVGEYVAFNLHNTGLGSSITLPSGNSTVTIGGSNPFPSLYVKELGLLVYVIVGIVVGLFLARDVYRRRAASSADPSSVPGPRSALSSVVKRATSQVNATGIEKEPAAAFAIVGGILLILGSIYLSTYDWFSSQTFGTGGVKEIEGAVLGALVIYLALAFQSRPSWRQPSGVLIIAMALIVLSESSEIPVEVGVGFAIIGGGLAIASSDSKRVENQ